MKWIKTIALVGCFLLALSLCACSLLERAGVGGDSPEPDSGGQEALDPEYPVRAGGVELVARPGRVVSLAPAVTEKLYDLGMDDRLVGVSDYCDYPGAVTQLTPCGTAQVPDVEVIEALSPHLVLTEAELPDSALERLEELGIPVAAFPHAGSVEQLLSTYTDLARLLEGDTAGGLIGESVTREFTERLSALERTLSSYTAREGQKTALYLRLLDFTVATGDTFENELLSKICLYNLAEPYTGWEYPADLAQTGEGQASFSGVDILFMDPDFITVQDLEQNEFYRGLPAVIQDRYLYISSLVMERQSLRTVDQLELMAAYTYPDAGVQTDAEELYAPDGEPQEQGDEPALADGDPVEG